MRLKTVHVIQGDVIFTFDWSGRSHKMRLQRTEDVRDLSSVGVTHPQFWCSSHLLHRLLNKLSSSPGGLSLLRDDLWLVKSLFSSKSSCEFFRACRTTTAAWTSSVHSGRNSSVGSERVPITTPRSRDTNAVRPKRSRIQESRRVFIRLAPTPHQQLSTRLLTYVTGVKTSVRFAVLMKRVRFDRRRRAKMKLIPPPALCRPRGL